MLRNFKEKVTSTLRATKQNTIQLNSELTTLKQERDNLLGQVKAGIKNVDNEFQKFRAQETKKIQDLTQQAEIDKNRLLGEQKRLFEEDIGTQKKIIDDLKTKLQACFMSRLQIRTMKFVR